MTNPELELKALSAQLDARSRGHLERLLEANGMLQPERLGGLGTNRRLDNLAAGFDRKILEETTSALIGSLKQDLTRFGNHSSIALTLFAALVVLEAVLVWRAFSGNSDPAKIGALANVLPLGAVGTWYGVMLRAIRQAREALMKTNALLVRSRNENSAKTAAKK